MRLALAGSMAEDMEAEGGVCHGGDGGQRLLDGDAERSLVVELARGMQATVDPVVERG